MSQPLLLTDELLVRTLVERTNHSPSPRLLDRIVASAAVAEQARPPFRWPARRNVPGRRSWARVPAFAGAMVVVVVAVLAIVALRPAVTGPGHSPTAPPASPTPATQPSLPATPRPAPTGPTPTPEATLLGSVPAQRLHLGTDAAPIDVTEAFGSIWVANIHSNDVSRIDPTTLQEIARIPAGAGPAWFAVADNALWVTDQLRSGLFRIDPTTNFTVAQVGDVPPCGAPVVALGSIWQSACDGDQFIEIDAATNSVVQTFPAKGHFFLVFAGGQLITAGPGGLARLDPDTGAFAPIDPGITGDLWGSDGATVWMRTNAGMLRIDPTDGRTLATFPYPDAGSITFSGGHAWLTVGQVGLLEIDLATNQVVRTIPLARSQLVAREVAGFLWITDFDNSDLWRLTP